MHQINIHEAKTNLSKLIQEALNGEEVIIAKGKITMSDDFDAPLDDFSAYM